MKALPHIVTDDEFFFATKEQRKEWNARIAAGCDPPADLTVCAPLNIPKSGSWEETKQLWADQRRRELEDDDEADRLRGAWGE